ncbi:hypothetical protein DUI87_32273 [Hirundo rustica rustica]|uniref:Uncharacterized protein n=1 Tax=Hirundo rustica rustica TaxID=333673 RepID=A0A3M0IQE3_HIRRU|nr:hypothetical protein DUI87_32273 [Hirundo rustica rustica]
MSAAGPGPGSGAASRLRGKWLEGGPSGEDLGPAAEYEPAWVQVAKNAMDILACVKNGEKSQDAGIQRTEPEILLHYSSFRVWCGEAWPYAHILSVPVSETMSPYPGQPQYQALQQSQPYTIYPQTTQTYGLPPFGKE